MKKLRFALDKHYAKKAGFHCDLRIQKDPDSHTLFSFAIRKCIPKEHEKYLAIRTEDHDWKWLSFEGEIPEGEYGAGKIEKYDYGYCYLVKETDKIKVYDFHGEKKHLVGQYALVHIKDNQYLFLKVTNIKS